MHRSVNNNFDFCLSMLHIFILKNVCMSVECLFSNLCVCNVLNFLCDVAGARVFFFTVLCV